MNEDRRVLLILIATNGSAKETSPATTIHGRDHQSSSLRQRHEVQAECKQVPVSIDDAIEFQLTLYSQSVCQSFQIQNNGGYMRTLSNLYYLSSHQTACHQQ